MHTGYVQNKNVLTCVTDINVPCSCTQVTRVLTSMVHFLNHTKAYNTTPCEKVWAIKWVLMRHYENPTINRCDGVNCCEQPLMDCTTAADIITLRVTSCLYGIADAMRCFKMDDCKSVLFWLLGPSCCHGYREESYSMNCFFVPHSQSWDLYMEGAGLQ